MNKDYKIFMKTEWGKQYKNPLWQKKRLYILERDNWKCTDCDASDKTLNVHHQWYEEGMKVWEYPDICYKTLCTDCHANNHYIASGTFKNMRKYFFESGWTLFDLEILFTVMESKYNEDLQRGIHDLFQKYLDDLPKATEGKE